VEYIFKQRATASFNKVMVFFLFFCTSTRLSFSPSGWPRWQGKKEAKGMCIQLEDDGDGHALLLVLVRCTRHSTMKPFVLRPRRMMTECADIAYSLIKHAHLPLAALMPLFLY
jgi:hypothetical protein